MFAKFNFAPSLGAGELQRVRAGLAAGNVVAVGMLSKYWHVSRSQLILQGASLASFNPNMDRRCLT
ncbi:MULTISPECIES: hypothetical protein [Ralstonia solanacearum species complex]|uniref:hypothetical protein n=1 Tax=Ralstonia solanacearum species complex TaxID=3116862 RepID=UPI0002501336|nr:hypothetical protein [Ralstonia solanacearum]CCF98556.1 hypothetical protein RSK60_660004 [Ralstonia solanacearum K60]